MRTFDGTMDFANLANMYIGLRRKHPLVPAHRVKEYLDSPGDDTFREFLCPGHEWSPGNDEDTDREVAVHCVRCGRSGDI